MYRMHALQLYTMSRPCLGKNDLFGLLSLGAFFARIISPPISLHQWTRLKPAAQISAHFAPQQQRYSKRPHGGLLAVAVGGAQRAGPPITERPHR